MLGGSSSINGMLYVRGNPADFDGWAQMGCRGWSYDDVLPYFKSTSTTCRAMPRCAARAARCRSRTTAPILPLTHRFVEAAQQAGFPFTPDLNGSQQEGVGYSQMTRSGRFRGSTAQTFLARGAAAGRTCAVETKALASRLLFEGKRCIGVAFRQRRRIDEVRAGARGDRVGRHGQLAASAAGLRHRAGGASAVDRRRRWCTICRASAPT